MWVRNARRAATSRRVAVTTAISHVPSHASGAGRRPMSWAALRSSSRPDEPVPVGVAVELAGGDHPRERRAHRAGGDPEQLGQPHEGAAGSSGGSRPSRIESTSDRALNGRIAATQRSTMLHLLIMSI